MEIILLTIYLVVWIFMNFIFYKTGMPIFNRYALLSQLLILIGFLLLVFLGPHIQSLNETENKTRKEFEEMADDVSKEAENTADKVFKQPWLDAMSKRNRYYIASFTLIAFMPFFYMCWLFYSSTAPLARDGITSQAVYNQLVLFDVFLLELTAGFTGFILLLYTFFSKKTWFFYTVPGIYLFTFYKAYTNNPERIRNYILSLLLAIWPFFYLSKSSIVWSIPFIIIIPIILLMT